MVGELAPSVTEPRSSTVCDIEFDALLLQQLIDFFESDAGDGVQVFLLQWLELDNLRQPATGQQQQQ